MKMDGCLQKCVWVLLVALMCVVFVQTVQAAETYQFVTKWDLPTNPEFGGFVSAYPKGIAVDQSGNVYVMERGNNRMKVFDPNGNLLNQWNNLNLGNYTGWMNNSYSAGSIAIDQSGNLIMSDMYVPPVYTYTPQRVLINKWGIPGNGGDHFRYIEGIALDPSGNIYLATHDDNARQYHSILKFSSNGQFLKRWGMFGTGNDQFMWPGGVTVDSSGNVYVVEIIGNQTKKFDSNGNFITKWGSMGSGDGQFKYPDAIAVDSHGNVYIADSGNDRIQKFTSDGAFLGKWGSSGSSNGQFMSPTGIAVDSSGNVYVSDFYNSRIQKFAPVQQLSSIAVTSITPSTGENTGSVSIMDLSGSGFPSPVSVKLTQPGKLAITATGITVVSPSKITCNFDLTARDAGQWDVVVTRPDGQAATLPKGFTITTPSKTSLTVTSYPSGADLFIDGVQRGTTPATFTDVLSGAHAIAVTKLGYYGYYTEISITAGQPATVDVTLQPLETGTGIISVRSNPSGATILLDGVATGRTTPYDFYQITPGVHTIGLTLSGYDTYTKTVTVNSGMTVIVTSQWPYQPKDAVVMISSVPTGATIYIDDQQKGVTDTSIHLKPGTYILKLTKPKYEDNVSVISVGAGDAISVSKTLKSPGFECVLAVGALFCAGLLFMKRKA